MEKRPVKKPSNASIVLAFILLALFALCIGGSGMSGSGAGRAVWLCVGVALCAAAILLLQYYTKAKTAWDAEERDRKRERDALNRQEEARQHAIELEQAQQTERERFLRTHPTRRCTLEDCDKQNPDGSERQYLLGQAADKRGALYDRPAELLFTDEAAEVRVGGFTVGILSAADRMVLLPVKDAVDRVELSVTGTDAYDFTAQRFIKRFGATVAIRWYHTEEAVSSEEAKPSEASEPLAQETSEAKSAPQEGQSGEDADA